MATLTPEQYYYNFAALLLRPKKRPATFNVVTLSLSALVRDFEGTRSKRDFLPLQLST